MGSYKIVDLYESSEPSPSHTRLPPLTNRPHSPASRLSPMSPRLNHALSVQSDSSMSPPISPLSPAFRNMGLPKFSRLRIDTQLSPLHRAQRGFDSGVVFHGQVPPRSSHSSSSYSSSSSSGWAGSARNHGEFNETKCSPTELGLAGAYFLPTPSTRSSDWYSSAAGSVRRGRRHSKSKSVSSFSPEFEQKMNSDSSRSSSNGGGLAGERMAFRSPSSPIFSPLEASAGGAEVPSRTSRRLREATSTTKGGLTVLPSLDVCDQRRKLNRRENRRL
eukprot:762571_1